MSPYSLLELQAGWLGIDNSKQLNFVTDTCFFFSWERSGAVHLDDRVGFVLKLI